MATKLKNLSLTSVDLVRAGANQEADICLHKSADGTEEPTERETNILKRFINWLKENPTEGDQEPENTIEKADEEPDDQPDQTELCKSAIYESIKSIIADDSLTVEERSAMIEKSLGQYHDKMVELAKACPVEEPPAPQAEATPTEKSADISIEYDVEKSDIVDVEVVEKFNPYHGKDGRFASANSATSFTYAPGKSKAHDLAIQREKDRQAAAGGGAKQEEKKPTKDKGDVKTDSSKGELVHEYNDGTKSYELKNATMTDAEAKDWYVMMDSSIKATAATKLNAKKSDIDYDAETGRLTKWNDTDPSTNGFTTYQKEFYQTKIKGTKVTNVKPDGKEKSHFKDLEFEFEFLGGKH